MGTTDADSSYDMHRKRDVFSTGSERTMVYSLRRRYIVLEGVLLAHKTYTHPEIPSVAVSRRRCHRRKP